MGRKVGEHDFIMPSKAALRCVRNQATFSIGVFVWVPTKDGLDVKKSATKVRVSGPVTTAGYKAVHDKAKEVANALDAGAYDGPKTIRVGA